MFTDNAALCRFLVDKLSVTATKTSLQISDVYYGDQERLPRTPAVCVEPGEKTRELNGAPRRTLITFVNYIIVYHNPVKNATTIREEDDQRAEAIEALIHNDPYFLDTATSAHQVIDSLVTSIESGYQVRSNTLYRASRLTIQARTQEQLPSGGV